MHARSGELHDSCQHVEFNIILNFMLFSVRAVIMYASTDVYSGRWRSAIYTVDKRSSAQPNALASCIRGAGSEREIGIIMKLKEL